MDAALNRERPVFAKGHIKGQPRRREGKRRISSHRDQLRLESEEEAVSAQPAETVPAVPGSHSRCCRQVRATECDVRAVDGDMETR